MKLIGRQILEDFRKKHADARSQIESLEAEFKDADWNSSAELKQRYPKASLLKNQHAVFNLCWNKYRLLVQVSYRTKIVLIKKIGTHKEYESWSIDEP
jgi:mRNA interferase HigB